MFLTPFLLATTLVHSPVAGAPPRAVKPIVVKVLVLNFDPFVKSEGGKRLHEAFHWQAPKELARGYMFDLQLASRGFIKFNIAEWRDLNSIPTKADGFKWDADAYYTAWRTHKGLHDPDAVDYIKVIADNKVAPLIDSGKVDEVWVFGAPAFGFNESAMAGPGSFWINGPTFDKVKCKHAFAIMGFSYERGVAEMVHDLCHRAEGTMSHVYGGWNAAKPPTNWDKFSAYAKQGAGVAGVGNCHWPPNADGDYDYGNPRTVQSTADDWLSYPNLTGETKPVNRDSWGSNDYHRSYLRWWFTRLPKAPGVNADGRQNNWWKYLFRFWDYDEHGVPVKKK